MDAANRRVILLGKTGAGKSSTANTIFGEELFKTSHTSESGTRTCQTETRFVNGRKYTLIDSPGFFDTRMSEEDLKPEIIRCITESAPGPHAFLILLKVESYTEHEQAVVTRIRESFSEEVFKYATVVFTHGNELQKGQRIEDFVCRDQNLSDLVRKCGGRCHVIDNKYWKDIPENEYRSNKVQVEKLLQTIDKMIKDNNNRCYTNEMLQEAEEEIQKASNIRVVIVGKTRAGKSSTANTIFGEKLFMDVSSARSGTEKCQAATRFVNGRKYTLIDSPGFFDTSVTEEALKHEMKRCITMSAPGPHAFLIVLKVEKYTEHEQAVITKIKEYFSEEVFKYSTVVFTHGDLLQEGQTIEDIVCKDQNLSDLVRKCGDRCHVIDNKYWKDKPMNEYRSNKFQVEKLLQTIDKTIRDNNNRCYTNEMLQAVWEEMQRGTYLGKRSTRRNNKGFLVSFVRRFVGHDSSD